MNEENEIQLFDIPSWNIPVVEAKVAKLNKRADKIGCAHLEIVIHSEKLVNDPSYNSALYIKPEHIPKIKVFSISINGEGPKIDGWKFVGTLDHYSLPGNVIVNTVPGNTVPAQFYNSKPICDHCGKHRTRKETFILEGDQGDYQQVGRQCIKDFLGHNPQSIATFLQSLYKFMEELREDCDWSGGGYATSYYALSDVLKTSAAVIRTFGWTPKSAADENRESTSSYVSRIMNPPFAPSKSQLADYKELVAAVNVNDTTDVEEANKAVEWLAEQNDDNEYMHNLKTIANAGELTGKLLGYTCSIISAYQRAMDKLEYTKKEESLKLNEWVKGEVKDRIELTVTLNKTRILDGLYGTVLIHHMMDENGRTVTWFCNGESTMQQDHTYRVAATLKKFDKYNDWKQTHVNRVRVLEEISP